MSYSSYLSKGFDEMNVIGVKGVACFWCRMLLILIPLVNAFFALYELIITSQKIWLKAIGGSLLAVSLFLFLFSLAAATFLILSHLGIKFGPGSNFPFLLSCASTIAALVTEASLLSQITDTQTNILIQDLIDFCIRNSQEQIVQSFLISHSTMYSLSAYVKTRTSNIYGAAATFMSIWIIFVLLHCLCLFLLSKPKQENGFNTDAPLSPDHLKDLKTT